MHPLAIPPSGHDDQDLGLGTGKLRSRAVRHTPNIDALDFAATLLQA
jgi:hypothetical protein